MPGKLKIDPSDKRPPVAPVLPEPDKQADHHRQVRAARQTEIMEDYVELIADLIDATGEDPVAAWKMLRAELKAYSGDLYDKLEIVGLTKLDAIPEGYAVDLIKALKDEGAGTVLTLSAVTGTGVTPVLRQLIDVIEASRATEQELKEAVQWSP